MSTDTAVRLTRTFPVPPTTVWRAWTDPEEFAAWYGPGGARVEVIDYDVRVGGRRVVVMRVETPGEPMVMRFEGEFVEVDYPRRLVYTEVHVAADGAVTGPVTTVEVELDEDEGQTAVVLTHHGIPAGSPGETGWTMALEHLAQRLGG